MLDRWPDGTAHHAAGAKVVARSTAWSFGRHVPGRSVCARARGRDRL